MIYIPVLGALAYAAGTIFQKLIIRRKKIDTKLYQNAEFLANLFYFYAIKWEKVTHLEPVKISESLFIILIAIIFSFIFGIGLYERNLNVIIPAIIASLALIFSHIKKHHLEFNKYFVAAIFGSFFFALELVLSRLILDS